MLLTTGTRFYNVSLLSLSTVGKILPVKLPVEQQLNAETHI